MEEEFVTSIGISAERFWLNTLRQNQLALLKHSNEFKQRQAELEHLRFWIYDTTFAGMNGSKVYKNITPPKSKEEKVYSAEEANDMLLKSGLVKQ